MLLCSKNKINSDEKFRKIALKKNRKMLAKFSGVAKTERLIFVPQCLRNTEKCKAVQSGSYYLCAECNACKIGPINKKAHQLGYRALFILKGGRTIEQIIKEVKPKAVVGVACYFEGAQGIKLCEKYDVIVQFVPLTKDGCVNTDVDLNEVMEILGK